ncbi:MAG: hydroxymethylglutaryl-CoA reductase, degradative [Candidatus Bathyarchaeota archaeon]
MSQEREELLKLLSDEELDLFILTGGIDMDIADQMRENVIGITKIPIGVAENFVINGKSAIIPIATEEKSVIMQASIGAGLVPEGFKAATSGNTMIGQIQVLDVPDLDAAEDAILTEKEALLVDANTISRTRKAVDLQVKRLDTAVGKMLIVEIFADVRDSMGANLIDSMCELLAPTIARITGGRTLLRILSNLATRRTVNVTARVPVNSIGERVVDNIIAADAFAWADPYRASTSNKGVMNGVIGVLLATSNDTRAVEAGAHSYASISGSYRPLTKWIKDENGDLVGTLEMPMGIGTVGGVIQSHELANVVLRLMNVETASDLAMIVGSVGLASNLGALYIMVTEGIKSIQA